MSDDDNTVLRYNVVRDGLPPLLAQLWRYAIVLSGNRDTAEDLVQATCVRALERSHQFMPGTNLRRWVFTILSSIWRNELRSRHVRMGHGIIDAEFALVTDGLRDAEMNILCAQVLHEVESLPEAQREAVLLVYGEGFTYREAAQLLDVPIGTIMSRLAAARATLGTMKDDTSLLPTEADTQKINRSDGNGRR